MGLRPLRCTLYCSPPHTCPAPSPPPVQWMCFDACPVHACMPHVAPRIAALTPSAKIILMLRNPVSGLFSAEVRGEPNTSKTRPNTKVSVKWGPKQASAERRGVRGVRHRFLCAFPFSRL